MSATLAEHRSTSTCEMGWLLPVRTAHVCCASGSWRGGELEVRLGPAASGEGPAGYKGVERAWAAAPRDPTAAGRPGPEPGDDCEFRDDFGRRTTKKLKSHKKLEVSTSLPLLLPIVLHPFAWHIVAREQREENPKRVQCACPCRPVIAFLLFPLPSFYCISQKCRILKDLTLQYLLFPPTQFYTHYILQYPPRTKQITPTQWVQQLLVPVPFQLIAPTT